MTPVPLSHSNPAHDSGDVEKPNCPISAHLKKSFNRDGAIMVLEDLMNNYFENIIANRAVLLDTDEMLAGNETVSIETQDDLVESGLSTFIQSNFAQFLHQLSYLAKHEKDLLLSYFVLGKSQKSIGAVLGITRTMCSTQTRHAIQAIGAMVMLGTPTGEVMSEILTANGLGDLYSRLLPVTCVERRSAPLSKLVAAYANTRSFQAVADAYGIHRATIRKSITVASKKLLESKKPRDMALGAYLFNLKEKASPSGRGLSMRQRAKPIGIYLKDPLLFDRFRVDAASPEFDHLFTARVNY
jgi:hypothetical protein